MYIHMYIVHVQDSWSESHEERLNILGSRVTEINTLLSSLMDGSSARLWSHMDLSIPSHLNLNTISRLKDQNRLLTQEVGNADHRVAQLESDKAALLRQLFSSEA